LKKVVKEGLLFGAAAVLVVLILLAAAGINKKHENYDIIFLGDSIVGNKTDGIGITDVLQERLDKSVYNGALGGTCMSYNNGKRWESLNISQWSMVKLAQAIYAEDWTSQLAGARDADKYRLINQTVTDYFYPRILGLSQIDFSKAEVLLIEHGTNDYNNGQRLDSKEYPMDTDTFGGALRTSLYLLRKKYPDLRIVLISPVYCEIQGGTLQKCYETDFGGGVLDDYVELERQIAEEYGVEWLDMYYGSGIWEDNIDIYLYDKLHPTKEGVQLLGNRIADYLEEK